jgi:hypothetical protein
MDDVFPSKSCCWLCQQVSCLWFAGTREHANFLRWMWGTGLGFSRDHFAREPPKVERVPPNECGGYCPCWDWADIHLTWMLMGCLPKVQTQITLRVVFKVNLTEPHFQKWRTQPQCAFAGNAFWWFSCAGFTENQAPRGLRTSSFLPSLGFPGLSSISFPAVCEMMEHFWLLALFLPHPSPESRAVPPEVCGQYQNPSDTVPYSGADAACQELGWGWRRRDSFWFHIHLACLPVPPGLRAWFIKEDLIQSWERF